MTKQRPKSALIHVLLALIPYSSDNLKLVFAPKRFFNDLSASSKIKEQTLRVAFSRAKSRGLINQNKVTQYPKLTEEGVFKLQPFVAKKLSREGGQLLVIFDIPENQAIKRRLLRELLKTWHFKQIQKSVWATNYDYVEYIKKAIKEWELKEYVELYEGARI